MGRRGSGGGGFRSALRVKTPAPKPATKPSAPPPAQTTGAAPTSIFGTVGTAIADGIGWGVGTSVAHRALDSVLGPRTIRVERTESSPHASSPPAAPADACSIHNQAFGDCINQNGSDISRCQFYLDLLNQCRRNGAGGAAPTIA